MLSYFVCWGGGRRKRWIKNSTTDPLCNFWPQNVDLLNHQADLFKMDFRQILLGLRLIFFLPDAAFEETSLSLCNFYLIQYLMQHLKKPPWLVQFLPNKAFEETSLAFAIFTWCNIWRNLLGLCNFYLMQHLKKPPWLVQFFAKSSVAACLQSSAHFEASYPSIAWHFY